MTTPQKCAKDGWNSDCGTGNKYCSTQCEDSKEVYDAAMWVWASRLRCLELEKWLAQWMFVGLSVRSERVLRVKEISSGCTR